MCLLGSAPTKEQHRSETRSLLPAAFSLGPGSKLSFTPRDSGPIGYSAGHFSAAVPLDAAGA